MSDVKFNEEPLPHYATPVSKKSDLLSLPIRLGVAKNEQGAVTAWIGFVVVCVVIIAFTFLKSHVTTSVSEQQYKQWAENQRNLVPSGSL